LSSLARDAEGAFTHRLGCASKPGDLTRLALPAPLSLSLRAAIQSLDIGQRVRLSNGHIGTIRHVGAGHWAPGDFVGVELGAFTSWR
jgi:hypothetical protein